MAHIKAGTPYAARARASSLAIATALTGIVISFLAFYNLELAPSTWNDEGAALTLAQTLANEGIYAIRNSEGVQTFGAVQSVGPTVILPVAMSLKLLGAGLAQGRLVGACYMVICLILFFAAAHRLFGPRSALLATILLLGTPAAHFLFFGRQVLGEVPAFTFFLAGWTAWAVGVHQGSRFAYALLGGLLIGLAIVTKSQYLAMALGTCLLVATLDLLYYRQRQAAGLLIMAGVAGACAFAWLLWQRMYYGSDLFAENMAHLGALAKSSSGFIRSMRVAAVRNLLGPDTGHFYFFWGFPALIYAVHLCARRNPASLILAFLAAHTLMWLAYYLLVSTQWPGNLFVPAALTAIFLAGFVARLTDDFQLSWHSLRDELREGGVSSNLPKFCLILGFALMALHGLQSSVRDSVLSRDTSPQQVSAFLDRVVPENAIIETNDREVAALSSRVYHYPEQALYAQFLDSYFQGKPQHYRLGIDYLRRHRAQYLVVGFYGRWTNIYGDSIFDDYACLIGTFGTGDHRYEVFHIRPQAQITPTDEIYERENCQ